MKRRNRRLLRRIAKRFRGAVGYLVLLAASLVLFLALLHSCSVPPDAQDEEPMRVELRNE